MRSILAWTMAAALAAVGCGDGSIGDGDGGGNGNGDGGSGGDDGGGPDDEFVDSGPDPASCKRVDLVFSLDGSSSMDEEKAAMSGDVFPAFANALINVGGGLDDYRVGAIDACPDPASFHTRGVSGPCNFSSGEVWMESDSPALAAEFGCVADLYIDDNNCSGENDDEQPASTAAAALEPPWSTGANAGFRRNDALLVVVAITDEDEQPTGAAFSAQEVFDRLVATAGGDVTRMVFLGIGGASQCTGVYGDADQAVKLREIANLFIANERGVFWDLCNGRLEDGLTEAMEVIEQACDEFPPIP